MDSPAGLSVCIVAYNALDKLRVCLRTLLAQRLDRPLEVLVWDNDSVEPVAATLPVEFPTVRLLGEGVNHGFAGGTNRCVAASTQPLVLLLNPDTELREPDLLARLVQRFAAHPELGALGCRLELPDGSTQTIAPRAPRAWEVVGDLCHRGLPLVTAEPGAELLDGGYVCGAALLTSRAVWERVGPLDDGCFMYFEDADWCARARRLGLRIASAPDLTIVHHEGACYGGKSFVRREHFWRALVRYLRRNDGPAAVGLVRAALAVSAAVKLPLAWLRDRSPERAARRTLLWAQLSLGLRGR